MSRETPGSTANGAWFYRLALFTPVFALSLAGVTALLVLAGSKRTPRARTGVEVPTSQVAPARVTSTHSVSEKPARKAPRATPSAAFGTVTPTLATAAAGEGALDADGQALLDQLIEEEQQTLQPEDLELDPTPPPLDLRTIKAYRDQNIDADGNLN